MITVPTDNLSIYDALNTLEMQGTRLALVRPNNPPPGVAGFLFDIEDENNSQLESDITDQYVEANTAVQDMIALRPETVTVTAQVAELVKSVPTVAPVAAVPTTLPTVRSLEPELSPEATDTQAETEQSTTGAQDAAASDQSLYGYYQSHLPQQPNQTKQSLTYGYIYQLWKGRQLFSVETPWGFFTNMAILSVSVRQTPETRSVSEFTITFKKIRTVNILDIQPGQLDGRATAQQAAPSLGGTIGQKGLTDAQLGQVIQYIQNPSP